MTMESITERYNVVKYVDEYYTQYHPLPVITSVPKSRDLLIFMISEDKLDIVNEACISLHLYKEVANGKTVFT
ncbi:MPPV-024 ankyrin repeat protein [Magpiepox virus 2]|nr:MPPV-024 ankyrin repeat protein [Magpiepox virus 2]